MEYEPVIGLEVHVQLKTNTKMFTRASYHYGAEPNTLTDPVVLGMPGTLPVMNRKAIEMTIQAGLLLGCKIPETHASGIERITFIQTCPRTIKSLNLISPFAMVVK